MQNRIEKAIDTFLDALNEGTLAKGYCKACAVGNLVAKGLKGKISILKNDGFIYVDCNVENDNWGNLFLTSKGVQSKYNYGPCDITNKALENIEATDFSMEELMKIEYAFETNTEIMIQNYSDYSREAIRQDQINGLKAVIKVMEGFEVNPEFKQNSYADEFENKANLIPLK